MNPVIINRVFFSVLFFSAVVALCLGFGCESCFASYVDIVKPINDKGNEIVGMIKSVFGVIATITIVIGVIGMATPWIRDKAAFFKTIAFIFLAAILMANLDAVKELIGLTDL